MQPRRLPDCLHTQSLPASPCRMHRAHSQPSVQQSTALGQEEQCVAAQGHSSWCILPGGRGNTRCPQAEQRGWEQSCWEQGHPYTRNLYGYTVTIFHRRKVLPAGTHYRHLRTPQRLWEGGSAGGCWRRGLVGLEAAHTAGHRKHRDGTRSLAPHISLPGGIPRDKGVQRSSGW